jgi:hypothetical protein
MNRKKILYILGSVVLFVAACFVIPKVMRMITNKAYKECLKTETDEDDWGPELVKKAEA